MTGSRCAFALGLGLGLRPPAAARGSRGVRPLLCHSGALASQGQWRLAEGSPRGRQRRVSAGRSGDCLDPQLLALRPAPNYRPKRGGLNSSALCIALIRTFQNLRHLLTGASAGPSTCHFRFLLEPSRKIPPNGALVPAGMTAVAMAQESRSRAIGSAGQATRPRHPPPS